MKKVLSLLLVVVLALIPISNVKSVGAAAFNPYEYELKEGVKFTSTKRDGICGDFLKIKAKVDGIATVKIERIKEEANQSFVDVMGLWTLQKKLIADIPEGRKENSFAVKKGEELYVLVVSENSRYNISYNIKKQKNYSNAVSKKKAPTLKKNKVANGCVFYSDKVKDAKWYKINVKKKGKVTVSLNYKTLNKNVKSCNFVLCNKKGKTIAKANGKSAIKKKLAKGTYYIKVGKTSNDLTESFGSYKLKWK